MAISLQCPASLDPNGFNLQAIVFEVLWKPKSVGRRTRKLTYVGTLVRDTGLDIQDLKTAMLDRNCWREIVQSIVSTAVEQ